MNRQTINRLTKDNNYKKVGKTFQESLSPNEIKEKLENYKRVDEIEGIPLNTHIRYFTNDKKTGKKHFRLGGFLTKLDKEYIVLSNGKLSWSVQKNNSIFFAKISNNTISPKEIEKYDEKIQNLIEENKRLKDTLKQVKNSVKKNHKV
jgi:hypothetical protein